MSPTEKALIGRIGTRPDTFLTEIIAEPKLLGALDRAIILLTCRFNLGRLPVTELRNLPLVLLLQVHIEWLGKIRVVGMYPVVPLFFGNVLWGQADVRQCLIQ